METAWVKEADSKKCGFRAIRSADSLDKVVEFKEGKEKSN
jgi:hypothetical protein